MRKKLYLSPFPLAEERRLMYVAMTRARQKVFVVTDAGRESVFVLELEGTKEKIPINDLSGVWG